MALNVCVSPVIVNIRFQGGEKEVDWRVRAVGATVIQSITTQCQQHQEKQDQNSKEQSYDSDFQGVVHISDTARKEEPKK